MNLAPVSPRGLLCELCNTSVHASRRLTSLRIVYLEVTLFLRFQHRGEVASGPSGSFCEDDGLADWCGHRLHGCPGGLSPNVRMDCLISVCLLVFREVARHVQFSTGLFFTAKLAPCNDAISTRDHLPCVRSLIVLCVCGRWRLGPTSCRCLRPWADSLARIISTTEPCLA